MNKELTQNLLENFPLPLVLFDVSQKKNIYYSRQAKELLGYSCEQFDRFANHNFEEIIHPEDYQQHCETMEKLSVGKKGEIIRSDRRFLSADGKYLHLQLYDNVLEKKNEDQFIISIVGFDLSKVIKESKLAPENHTFSNEYIEGEITKLLDQIEEEKKKKMQAQLMMLSSQLNPHFIFSSLNSIHHHILNSAPESALLFTSRFSSLMRKMLEFSKKLLISLEDEINFLDEYLTLEKERFSDAFDFEIINTIDSEVYIPPMLLQPYVENALLHGLAELNKRGNLKIHLHKNEKQDLIFCEIIDNGKGRKKAAENINPEHKSYATNMTSFRLELLKNIYKNEEVSVKFSDLEEDGQSKGTAVTVTFPNVDLNGSLSL